MTSWIDNPVLKRELIRIWRPRRTRGLSSPRRWLMGLGWLNLLLLTTVVTGNRVGAQWRSVFSDVALLQLIMLPILSAALAANVFTHDREQRTLELLLLTRLRAAEICSGKLFSRLVTTGWFFLSSLPITLGAANMGKMSPWRVAATYTVVLSTTFTFTVVAVCCSAHFRRTQAAIALAVALAALPVPVAFLLDRLGYAPWKGGGGTGIWAYLSTIEPFTAVGGYLQYPKMETPFAWMPNGAVWIHTVFWQMSVALTLFAWLCRDLRWSRDG